MSVRLGSRIVANGVLTVFLLASCGDDDDVDRAARETASEELDAIVADLNNYWGSVDDELGFDYAPVPAERITTGADGVLCNGEPIDPADVEGNALVDDSCREGIAVAYDPEYVTESLARAEATMAHEWGHVVQAQATELDLSLDPDGLPIDGELQADCFAGAWAAERAESDVARLRSDTARAGDPDDVEIDDPEAHGTFEERAVAFDVGLDGGPAACVNELIDALP